MQSKNKSLIESITNTTVGLITAFCIQMIIYPALNIKVTISENIIITAVFYLVSIGRNYIVRRFFEKNN